MTRWAGMHYRANWGVHEIGSTGRACSTRMHSEQGPVCDRLCGRGQRATREGWSRCRCRRGVARPVCCRHGRRRLPLRDRVWNVSRGRCASCAQPSRIGSSTPVPSAKTQRPGAGVPSGRRRLASRAAMRGSRSSQAAWRRSSARNDQAVTAPNSSWPTSEGRRALAADAGQSKVPVVPEGHREAEDLVPVADAGDAVLVPPVGAGARGRAESSPRPCRARCSPRARCPRPAPTGTVPSASSAPCAPAPRPVFALPSSSRPSCRGVQGRAAGVTARAIRWGLAAIHAVMQQAYDRLRRPCAMGGRVAFRRDGGAGAVARSSGSSGSRWRPNGQPPATRARHRTGCSPAPVPRPRAPAASRVRVRASCPERKDDPGHGKRARGPAGCVPAAVR